MLSPVATIDLDALKTNLRLLQEKVQPKGVLAVVKWNAYGHGLLPCVKTLAAAGAAAFGVSSPADGVTLRKAGITEPILVMTDWVGKPIAQFYDYDLHAAATSWYKVEYLAAVAKKIGKSIPAHIEFDTGLGRVGIPFNDAREALAKMAAMKQLNIAALYSHLDYSGPQDHEKYARQIERFLDIVNFAQKLGINPRWTHLANSAAALAIPNIPGNLVRTGIALYGQPTTADLRHELPLEPVMTLKGFVTKVQRVKRGHGYPNPLLYRAPIDGYGAEIALGFQANYPRSFAGFVPVLFRGKRVPVVGIIGKKHSHIFTGTDKPDIGEEIVFWGRQNGETLFLFELAPKIGALAYELPTWLSPKLTREFVTHPDPLAVRDAGLAQTHVI